MRWDDFQAVPDASLVRMAAVGWASAFDELVRRHRPALEAFISRKVYDASELHDALQETWYRVYRDLGQFSPESGSFVNWLRGYADNVVKEHNRRHRELLNGAAEELEVLAARLDTLVTLPETPASNHRATETAMDAVRGWARLPESYRVPLLVDVMDDAGPTDIANLLDISIAAAKMRLLRARDLVEKLAGTKNGDASAVKPLLGETTFQIGRLCIRNDQFDRGSRWLRRGIDMDARVISWIKDLGHTTTRPDLEHPVFCDVLTNAMQQHPRNQHLAYEYANMIRNCRGWPVSHGLYHNAWKMNPDNEHAAVLLAISHIVLNEHAEAFKVIEPYLQKPDVDTETLMTAAEALAPIGPQERARELLRPMRERIEGQKPEDVLSGQLPEYSRYYVATRYKAFGHCLTAIGDLDDARDCYEKGLTLVKSMGDVGPIQAHEALKCQEGFKRIQMQEGSGRWIPLQIEHY
ncbi:MAG: sigma-70 family RNA polymerase sigma factor [Armatimonadota bacterium]